MSLHQHRMRSGAILIAVLACLLVALSLVLTAVQSSIRARRECKEASLMRQTQLLVEAGALHAIKKLRKSYDYKGEIWTPTLAHNGDFDASVQIESEPSSGQDAADDRTITIIAKLESRERSTHTTQRSFRFVIHKNSITPSELK